MTSPAALASIRKLRRLAVALAEGRVPDAGDATWLANGFKQYLGAAERGETLEAVFDLAPGPGGVTWFDFDRRALRDAVLCEMAERFWPECKVGRQAREIERRASRYAAAAWRFDSERLAMPARYIGTELEYLWRAFRAGGMPLKRRQLERVLTVEKRGCAV